MKKAFSLIEFMVVVGLASVLLFATANFLIFSVQRNNQISVENAVKSEANYLMDSIRRDIRNSSCECYTENSISLYGSASCDCGGAGPTPYASYQISGDGLLNFQRNSVVLNSSAVKIQNCTTCACSPPAGSGFVVAKPTLTVRAYFVTLSLRQSRDNPRSDFCGKVQLQETIKTRN